MKSKSYRKRNISRKITISRKRKISNKRKTSNKRKNSKKRLTKQQGGVNKQDVLIETMCYDLDDTEIKDTKIYKLIKGLCNNRYISQSIENETSQILEEKPNKKSSNMFVNLLKSTGSLLTMPASIAMNTMNRVTGIGNSFIKKNESDDDDDELKELKKLQEINYRLKSNRLK